MFVIDDNRKEGFLMKKQNDALRKFKEEIASELHVDLKRGAENTSRIGFTYHLQSTSLIIMTNFLLDLEHVWFESDAWQVLPAILHLRFR